MWNLKKFGKMFFERKSYEKGSNMNLNEECLLNYLTNPDNINSLSVLLGDMYLNQIEVQGQDVPVVQTIKA